MKKAVNLRYPAVKAIHDSLLTCFTSHLDQELQFNLQKYILQLFDIKKLPTLEQITRNQDIHEKYVVVEDFIIPRGKYPQEFRQNDFILTKSFKALVQKLASIVAVTDYAVILEGPTSAGKTSTVQYLANVTGNKILRINNHMHTDI